MSFFQRYKKSKYLQILTERKNVKLQNLGQRNGKNIKNLLVVVYYLKLVRLREQCGLSKNF